MRKIDKMVLRFLDKECGYGAHCEECEASSFCEEANKYYSDIGLRIDGELLIDKKEIEEE